MNHEKRINNRIRYGVLGFIGAVLLGFMALVLGLSPYFSQPMTYGLSMLTTLALTSLILVKAGRRYEDWLTHRISAECEASLKEATERNEMEKQTMFSAVSHELRTPLTAIRGWAETLSDPAYESEGEVIQEGLASIKQESLRLSQLVEELLDYTRLNSGEMAFSFESSDLIDVVLTTVSALKPKAAMKKIQLSAEISNAIYDDDALSMVHMDGNRMKQLCMNLIDNSLKFTPAGGQVKIGVTRSPSEAIIRVWDTGCGIDPILLPKVKERFVKGSHSESHLGLGLAICEAVVKAHKGSWQINSNLGEGTHVVVNIPIEKYDSLTAVTEMVTLKSESAELAAKGGKP